MPTDVEGYHYYFFTAYGVWMVISPMSGFHSGLRSENSVLSIIRRELFNGTSTFNITEEKIEYA